MARPRSPPRRSTKASISASERARVLRSPSSREAAAERPAELWQRDRHLIGEPPQVERRAWVARRPGREDVAGDEALDALRVTQAEQEADPGAPVVPDQPHALESQGVQQREHVARHRLLVVAARRHAAPAEPAEVGADHARVRRESAGSRRATGTSAVASRAAPAPARPRRPRPRACAARRRLRSGARRRRPAGTRPPQGWRYQRRAPAARRCAARREPPFGRGRRWSRPPAALSPLSANCACRRSPTRSGRRREPGRASRR